jgi:hypothetical protein
VCYQCGPDDVTVTNYRCYPDAGVAVPVAVGLCALVLVTIFAWNAIKYKQYKESPSNPTLIAELRRARLVGGVVLTIGAVLFFTLGVVWYPVAGVDPIDCTDCATMDHVFWALFAVNTAGVLLFIWLFRSVDVGHKNDGQPEHGDQHYVPLTT